MEGVLLSFSVLYQETCYASQDTPPSHFWLLGFLSHCVWVFYSFMLALGIAT